MVKNICSRYRRSMLYPQAKTSQASSAPGLGGGMGQPHSNKGSRKGLIAALIVGGLATASTGLLAKPKADTEGQHPVIQAKNAFQSRNLAAIAQAERALANDPLRIWPEYWRQQLLVSGQPFSDQARLAITHFSQQHRDHHLVRALQRDWGVAALQSGPWGPQTRGVLEQIPRDLVHAGLQCAFARLNPAMPVSDRLLIVHGNEIARGCQGLLEEMAQSGALDESNLRTKARAMASLGEVAAAERLWSSFKRQGAFSASEKTTLSILSLSSRNSLQAATRFQKERGKLSVEQATFLEFNIGSRLWMRTDPRAGAMVQRGMPSLPHQPPLIQEAAARVSLRMGDWDNLRQILGAMPPSLRNQDHWAYWQGWLASQAGQTRKAKEIWAGIPQGWGFYQILAAEAWAVPSQHRLWTTACASESDNTESKSPTIRASTEGSNSRPWAFERRPAWSGTPFSRACPIPPSWPPANSLSRPASPIAPLPLPFAHKTTTTYSFDTPSCFAQKSTRPIEPSCLKRHGCWV